VTGTKSGIALLALLVVAVTMLAAAPPQAAASSLKERLRDSRNELRRAEVRLEKAKAALDAAYDAHQSRGLGPLLLDVEKCRRDVSRLKSIVRKLSAKLAAAASASAAASSGDWRTLIDRAAKKYGISAKGLYRLMMLESGGKARAVGAGRYYGLYQYALVTWEDDWNPWRGKSVYNGAAQIEASAYAIKKGMGRSLWGNTYPAAF
jgi:soluble lytic murein transglycosylase-like protein